MAKQTIARGAVIERDLVKRKMRRTMKRYPGPAAQFLLTMLIDWLDAQPARTKKRGGIGTR